MVIKILIIAIVILYAGLNLLTAKTHSANEMRDEFVTGQCVVGAIFTNIFYAPAWVLKIMKSIIIRLVK